MLTLTTVVHSGRQNPDGTTDPLSTHCFIAVVAVGRAPRETRGGDNTLCDPNGVRQSNSKSNSRIDHKKYDYE